MQLKVINKIMSILLLLVINSLYLFIILETGKSLFSSQIKMDNIKCKINLLLIFQY